MRIRVLRNLGANLPPFKEGEEHTVSDGEGQELCRRGLAEKIEQPEPPPKPPAPTPKPAPKTERPKSPGFTPNPVPATDSDKPVTPAKEK
jgi:hypothetical protein